MKRFKELTQGSYAYKVEKHMNRLLNLTESLCLTEQMLF